MTTTTKTVIAISAILIIIGMAIAGYYVWRQGLVAEGRIEQINQQVQVQVQQSQAESKAAAQAAQNAHDEAMEFAKQTQRLVVSMSQLQASMQKLQADNAELKQAIQRMSVPELMTDIRHRIGPQEGVVVALPPITDNDLRVIDTKLQEGESCASEYDLQGKQLDKCKSLVVSVQNQVDSKEKELVATKQQSAADLNSVNVKLEGCQQNLKLKTPGFWRNLWNRVGPVVGLVAGIAIGTAL